jgi:hypothetical protein
MKDIIVEIWSHQIILDMEEVKVIYQELQSNKDATLDDATVKTIFFVLLGMKQLPSIRMFCQFLHGWTLKKKFGYLNQCKVIRLNFA